MEILHTRTMQPTLDTSTLFQNVVTHRNSDHFDSCSNLIIFFYSLKSLLCEQELIVTLQTMFVSEGNPRVTKRLIF